MQEEVGKLLYCCAVQHKSELRDFLNPPPSGMQELQDVTIMGKMFRCRSLTKIVGVGS